MLTVVGGIAQEIRAYREQPVCRNLPTAEFTATRSKKQLASAALEAVGQEVGAVAQTAGLTASAAPFRSQLGFQPRHCYPCLLGFRAATRNYQIVVGCQANRRLTRYRIFYLTGNAGTSSATHAGFPRLFVS